MTQGRAGVRVQLRGLLPHREPTGLGIDRATNGRAAGSLPGHDPSSARGPEAGGERTVQAAGPASALTSWVLTWRFSEQP